MTPSIALMTYDPQGDWRGISRHFVQSRTPTQVASHAQKYFIRQNNMNKRKRRSSLGAVHVAQGRPINGELVLAAWRRRRRRGGGAFVGLRV